MVSVDNLLSVSINEQTPVEVSFDAEAFVQAVLHHKGVLQGSLDITFVGPAAIEEINRTYLGHDYVTDVITFLLSDPGEVFLVGDIYICPEEARQNAASFSSNAETEMRLLMVHGILHLLGYDDQTPEDAAKMGLEQDRLVNMLSDRWVL